MQNYTRERNERLLPAHAIRPCVCRDCIAENWIMPWPPSRRYKRRSSSCVVANDCAPRFPGWRGRILQIFRRFALLAKAWFWFSFSRNRQWAKMPNILKIPGFIVRLTAIGKMKRIEFSWTIIFSAACDNDARSVIDTRTKFRAHNRQKASWFYFRKRNIKISSFYLNHGELLQYLSNYHRHRKSNEKVIKNL